MNPLARLAETVATFLAFAAAGIVVGRVHDRLRDENRAEFKRDVQRTLDALPVVES